MRLTNRGMMRAAHSTLALLERLVAFDTVSRHSNLEMIDFMEGWLAEYGVPCWRIPFGPEKANLLARIGPEAPGGIVLSGHTDVVPVDDQDWRTDPFRLHVDEETGRAYGRGTADMKGFIASALALVPEIVGLPLSRPVYLAFSCDEEVGCTGVRPMIAWMRAHLPPIAGVFVGEPTGMKVVTAHKGIMSATTVITGREAHSSCPHLGVNAAHFAAPVMTKIIELSAALAEQADEDSGFDPPYTTVQIGRVRAGTARNIVPRHCTIEWEARLMPDADGDALIAEVDDFCRTQVEPEMKAHWPGAGIVTEVNNRVPGLKHDPDSWPVQAALQALGENATHCVPYGTEAGLFQEAEMPAVVCGPGHIAQAHKPDEYVDLSQLEACDAFLRRLVKNCL